MKSYDAHLSAADSGVVFRQDVDGRFDTFTAALAAVSAHLALSASKCAVVGSDADFRALVDRLAWLSLGHPNLDAYGLGGGDFSHAAGIMAKRARQSKSGAQYGYVVRFDAKGRFEIDEGAGWAVLKDAKAQAAAFLRTLAMRASDPPLVEQALRSLAELASGSRTDFIPMHWDHDLVAWVHTDLDEPVFQAIVELVPEGLSHEDAVDAILGAYRATIDAPSTIAPDARRP